MNKKIPLRKCVATNELLPKKEMIRVVKNKEGEVFVDLTSKANGRGAYIKKSLEALEMAKKKNCLGKALETTIKEEVYEELLKIING
ncbi:MAG: YlxR family protein [Bacilli bacterium]|nr:YlxR family protein [Bacilli bacterium]